MAGVIPSTGGLDAAAVQAMIDSAVSGLATQSALTTLSGTVAGKADISSVPTPATSAPPSVQDSSAQGNIARFAMENHTHASKTRRQVVTMPSASSTYTWTYPTPFSAGVSPAVCAIVQVPAGTTDLFNVQVQGSPTNTSCVFQINRVSAGLLSLLLGALSLNPTPIAATLHCFALEP